jgi:hypothetical protein
MEQEFKKLSKVWKPMLLRIKNFTPNEDIEKIKRARTHIYISSLLSEERKEIRGLIIQPSKYTEDEFINKLLKYI